MNGMAKMRGGLALSTAVVLSLATGAVRADEFLVVDLSGGKDAARYPAKVVTASDSSVFAADDVYKTDRLVLRRVPAQTFWMGVGDNGDITASSNRHLVRLTHDFCLGVFPVTQRQYELVTGQTPSAFAQAADAARHPVERLDYEALAASDGFFARLNAKVVAEGLEGAFALPTEAQWECACRAGTLTTYFWGNDPARLCEYGWTTNFPSYRWASANPIRETHAVGSKKPNPLGFYDLYGNVWETCADRLGNYPTNALDAAGRPVPVVDPTGPRNPDLFHVLRGGVWNAHASGARTSFRRGSGERNVHHNCGFRAAFVVTPPKRAYRALSVDPAGLPAGKEFLADIVLRRVTERSRVATAGVGAYCLRFALDPLQPEEGFVLEMKDGAAEIRARGFAGFLYGAGKFLRTIEYSADSIGVRVGFFAERPRSVFRNAYMARHFGNWYDRAPVALQNAYVEDLALWGINGISTMIVTPVQVQGGADSPAVRESVAVYKATYDNAKRLGLLVRAGLGLGNQTGWDTDPRCRGTALTNPIFNLGFNACPHAPGTLARIDENAEMRLKAVGPEYLPDVTCVFPYDEGGCACMRCAPWGGNGYLLLCERAQKWLAAHAPRTKFMACTWMFQDDEWELLEGRIRKGFRPDYIMVDAHGDQFPKYPLTHDLGGIPLVTFPEISMWGRFPWGGYGAQPLPKRFRRIFDQVKDRVTGYVYYSEGIYEDINKLCVQQFYWNDADEQETLRAYARFYLPGCREEDFVALCELLEENHLAPDVARAKPRDKEAEATYLERIDRALGLVRKMDAAILPSMRDGWRWRMLVCRAELDRELFRSDNGWAQTKRGNELMNELIRIDWCDTREGDRSLPNHFCIRPPQLERKEKTEL